MTSFDHLPPLFTTNNKRPMQGELNIIHERIPAQRRGAPAKITAKKGEARKTSCKPIFGTAEIVSDGGIFREKTPVNQGKRGDSNGQHRYIDKMNERQKRMEQKYFNKDGSTEQHSRQISTTATTVKHQYSSHFGKPSSYDDFKKRSCATFSSTLRNFQDNGYAEPETAQKADDVEESIQEDIID